MDAGRTDAGPKDVGQPAAGPTRAAPTPAGHRLLGTVVILLGAACLAAAVATVILRAAGLVDVPLALTTALAAPGAVLIPAGVAARSPRPGRR